jgi:hypothetical protein
VDIVVGYVQIVFDFIAAIPTPRAAMKAAEIRLIMQRIIGDSPLVHTAPNSPSLPMTVECSP